MPENDAVTLSMKLTLPHPVSIFGITIHGVQPLFLISDCLHIPDRNILSKICSKNLTDADIYWVSQLNSPGITFNPIFTAVEGIRKKIPTREEFIEQYFSAEKCIKENLPLAIFTPHTEATLSKSYMLVESLVDRRNRESAFLVKVAPLVAVRSADSQLLVKEQEILSHAADNGLTGGSLSLLAVLSCLYECTGGDPVSAGRGVLHPTKIYSPENAHNCLSDLLAIELLVVGSSLGLGKNAFITADKNLVRFWQALGVSATPPINGVGTGKFRISNKLLHRIDEAGLNRLERLFSLQ